MAKSYVISLFFLLTCFGTTGTTFAAGPPQPVFIFGDSSSDVGTNTYIPECLAKADFPHYGIDFDNFQATGRWSNRFNTIDYICKSMGYQRSPEPFLSYGNKIISPTEMSRGVNFASGGSGLLNTTGQDLFIIPVWEQIQQFISIRNNAIDTMGRLEADAFFAGSIFIISAGTNDMEYSYFRGLIRSQTIFLDEIMLSYKNTIEVLYGQGARNFGLISALPAGCLPLLRSQNVTGGCLDSQNQLSLNFYNNLNNLAREISSNLKGFKYSLGNTYHMITNFIENTPPSDGMVVDTACCGSGRLNGEEFCSVTANLCTNREKYAFFDPAHPTDAASKAAALAIYDGGLEFVSPINFRQLVAGATLISSQ